MYSDIQVSRVRSNSSIDVLPDAQHLSAIEKSAFMTLD